MTAPTIGNVQTNTGSGTLASVTLPTGTPDYYLASTCKDDNDNIGYSVFTTLHGGTIVSGSSELIAGYRARNGSDPANIQADWSSAGGSEDWAAIAFGVIGTAGLDTSGSASSPGNALTLDAPALTVAENDSLDVIMCGSEDGGTVFVTPIGYSRLIGVTDAANTITQGSGTTGAATAVFYKTINSGSTAAVSIVQSQDQEMTISRSIWRPAGGGGAPAAFTPRVIFY